MPNTTRSIVLSLLFSLLLPCCVHKDTIGVLVYVTQTGNKYHKSECRYLSRSCAPISLEEAALQGYEPCSECSPPVYQKPVEADPAPEPLLVPDVKKEPEQTLGQELYRCTGITRLGVQCKRMIRNADHKCFQHKNQ